MTLTPTKEIKIDGIAYLVVREKSFQHEGKARVSLTVRRLKGKRLYVVIRYENGALSSLVPIPNV